MRIAKRIFAAIGRLADAADGRQPLNATGIEAMKQEGHLILASDLSPEDFRKVVKGCHAGHLNFCTLTGDVGIYYDAHAAEVFQLDPPANFREMAIIRALMPATTLRDLLITGKIAVTDKPSTRLQVVR